MQYADDDCTVSHYGKRAAEKNCLSAVFTYSQQPLEMDGSSNSVLLYDGSGDGRVDSDLYSDSSSSGLTPGRGWSDIIRIAEKAIEPEEALVAQYILNQFTPFTALLLAILPMFCFWFTMVLVILMFGVWGASVVGVMVYAFIMVAHVIIYFEYFPFPMSMPMHFSTLRDIVSGLEDGMQLQEVARVMGGYAALIAGIIAVMLVSVKKVDMSFSNEK